MARYHVCMVLVGKLPVPATLGGAVEALAQHLLEQNERDPQIEFTVLTVDEPKAQALAAGSSEFDIPMDRQQLADYLAVDRSAMSAALGKLRDEGVLTFRKNHFHLLRQGEERD